MISESENMASEIKFGNKDAAAFMRSRKFTSPFIKNNKIAAAVKKCLVQAISEGKGVRDWRKTVDAVYDSIGVARLKPAQAESIFRTEFSLAMGAVHFLKMQDVRDQFPYWEISAVFDDHKELEGKIFDASDVEFHPPLSEECNCVAILISRREAEKRGIRSKSIISPEIRSATTDNDFIACKVRMYQEWIKRKL
jgi:hypothetical protein